MIKRILQNTIDLSKAAVRGAIQGSGTAALYLCTSTLLAAVLLAVYLTFAWDIDKDRWYRAYATLMGIELVEIQQAERDAAAIISHEAVLQRRAERDRQDEFRQGIRQPVLETPPLPGTPPPPPPPGPSEEEIREVLNEAARAAARIDGLTQQIEDIAAMPPDSGKDIIRDIWRDDPDRVMTILYEMEERPRRRILQAFDTTDAAELRDLVAILQRIGDGEPMVSNVNNPTR